MTRNAPGPAFARDQRTSLKPPAAKRQPPLLKQPNSGAARPDRDTAPPGQLRRLGQGMMRSARGLQTGRCVDLAVHISSAIAPGPHARAGR